MRLPFPEHVLARGADDDLGAERGHAHLDAGVVLGELADEAAELG